MKRLARIDFAVEPSARPGGLRRLAPVALTLAALGVLGGSSDSPGVEPVPAASPIHAAHAPRPATTPTAGSRGHVKARQKKFPHPS